MKSGRPHHGQSIKIQFFDKDGNLNYDTNLLVGENLDIHSLDGVKLFINHGDVKGEEMHFYYNTRTKADAMIRDYDRMHEENEELKRKLFLIESINGLIDE